ncbi:hypothetical protein ABIF68_002968 [Bradyrhizobium japonicum]
MIDRGHDLSIVRQAKVLKLARSTVELWRNLGDDGVRKAAYRGG